MRSKPFENKKLFIRKITAILAVTCIFTSSSLLEALDCGADPELTICMPLYNKTRAAYETSTLPVAPGLYQNVCTRVVNGKQEIFDLQVVDACRSAFKSRTDGTWRTCAKFCRFVDGKPVFL